MTRVAPSRTPLALAAACLLCLTACGSTVQLSARSALTNDGLQAAPGADGTTSPIGQQPSSTTPSGAGAASAPGRVSASDVASGLTTRGTTSPARLPSSGRGWDKRTVYIGMTTTKDAETALAGLGISLSPGDEAGDALAVQNSVNASGGLFGRKVQIVIHDNKSADLIRDAAGAAEANCTYFTQDRPVIAVINTIATIDLDNFRSCLAKARLPLITLSTAPFDDTTERAYAPYYYNPVSVSWSRLAGLLLTRLAHQKFFTGWNTVTATPSPAARATIGVLYGQDAAGTRAADALIAGLRRAGYATDTYQYGQLTEGPAAVLRFEQDGVTHVISVDNFLFLFMTAADSQHYRPRYAVNSYNGIQALVQSDAPASQLPGSVGVGWFPGLDVDRDQAPVGPGQKQCLSALAAGGQTYSGKRFAQAVGLAICDGVHLAVMGASTGGGLDPVAMRKGIVRLGPNFPVAGGFASGLSSTNFALPGAGRDVQYSSGCSCYVYAGSTYPI